MVAEVLMEAIRKQQQLLHPLLPVWSVDSGVENQVVGRSLEAALVSDLCLLLLRLLFDRTE